VGPAEVQDKIKYASNTWWWEQRSKYLHCGSWTTSAEQSSEIFSQTGYLISFKSWTHSPTD